MRSHSLRDLSRYLLQGQISSRGCTFASASRLRAPKSSSRTVSAPSVRFLYSQQQDTDSYSQPSAIPLRKQLKDAAKAAKKTGGKQKKKPKSEDQVVDGWELTVGIEIHAQLNTSRKLFSSATTSFNDEPNSHVAPFDVAMPGSQPLFQKETLIPALRAALAFDCDIQRISRFDRKHYFWWDQPSGYQITQYYQPFAKDGHITLNARDGIAAEDGESINVRIKQIQLEQDTAKTLARSDGISWLDFNRVGAPLIEIITEPDIHHPRTAAIFVRKIQLMLNTVDACVSGMEAGGLRADVNVSVRRTGGILAQPLGTRTEIKNLSTIKAVEDAVIAERNRQIAAIEAGEQISSETRGWSIGSTETRRLRGKEGEVDYRYMPDPDIGPLVIGDDLVEHLRQDLAVLPDVELDKLIAHYGLTPKDGLSLLNLDDGARVLYFYRTVQRLEELLQPDLEDFPVHFKTYSALTANWIIHELGRLTTKKGGLDTSEGLVFTPLGECEQVPHLELAQLLYHLYQKQITGKVAKELLFGLYWGEIQNGVSQAIEDGGLWFQELSHEEYYVLADAAVDGEEQVLSEFVNYTTFPQGKLMFLVGKMMRLGPTERIDPATAEKVMRARVLKEEQR